MKAKTIRILAAIGKAASAATGLAAYTHFLPPSWLPAAAVGFAGVSAAKEIALVIGDLADDGKRNNSFKLPLLILAGMLLCGGLVSCATRPDGVKTFWGLDAGQWSNVGKGAVAGAAPVLVEEKSKAVPSK